MIPFRGRGRTSLLQYKATKIFYGLVKWVWGACPPCHPCGPAPAISIRNSRNVEQHFFSFQILGKEWDAQKHKIWFIYEIARNAHKIITSRESIGTTFLPYSGKWECTKLHRIWHNFDPKFAEGGRSISSSRPPNFNQAYLGVDDCTEMHKIISVSIQNSRKVTLQFENLCLYKTRGPSPSWEKEER